MRVRSCAWINQHFAVPADLSSILRGLYGFQGGLIPALGRQSSLLTNPLGADDLRIMFDVNNAWRYYQVHDHFVQL